MNQGACSQYLASVVLTGCGRPENLLASVRSLQAQTWTDFELIVVDTRPDAQAWTPLACGSMQIRVIRRPGARLAEARNAGLAAAEGSHVAFLDAGDLCTADRLALQVRCLARHPEVGLCCSAVDAGALADPPAAAIPASLPERDLLAGTAEQPVHVWQGLAYEALAHGNFIPTSTVMFRRSLLELVGGFDTEIGSMCDWDWLIRISSATRIGWIDRPLVQSATHRAAAESPVQGRCDRLRTAERLIERDRILYRAHCRQFRQELGAMCLGAADALSAIEPWRALKLLARAALRYGVLSRETLRIALKTLQQQGEQSGAVARS
jgi:hypothetical protein